MKQIVDQEINSSILNKSLFHSIPKDWEWKYLRELGQFTKGKGITKEQLADSGLPCIRYGEIYTTYDFIVKKIHSFIPEETSKESQLIKQGDILFAGSGETIEEIGKSVAYLGNGNAYAGGDIIILSTGKDVNAECLSYALETDYVRKQKRKLGQGHSVVHIYASDLSHIKIPLPPLPEQNAISKLLTTWDEAITKTQELLALKVQCKKWLMQNLLSGKKRLPGFNGEWKNYKLESFIEDYNEKPRDGIKYEILTSAKSGLMKQTDYYGDNRITNREDADYNVIPPNYLTYRSRSDDGLFTFNKNTLGFIGLISGYYPVFSIKSGDLDFILMYCNFYRQNFKKYSIGTSQLVLSMNGLKSASFKLPEEEEQTAISKVIRAADKEIQLMKSKTENLRTQKKGLMQQLLSGRIRIKGN